MSSDSRNWLDALTDGQVVRDFVSLNAHVFLASFYWGLGLGYLALSLALVPVIIGIPMLLLWLAMVRGLAAVDQQLMTGVLDREPIELRQDIDLRGANLGERLGLLLGSGITWRSLFYLALKMPLGIFTMSAAWMLLPFMAIEVLVMGPLGIDMRLVTVRLMHWLATISHEVPGLLIPRIRRRRPSGEKAKRDQRLSRLEDVKDIEYDEPRYILTDDGEIEYKQRF